MTQKIGPLAQKEEPRLGRDWRPPLTTQQRLDGIEEMCKRVNEYVEFMRGAEALRGSSAEAKEAAIAAFYERMTVLERQLSRIAEGLRLG